MSILQMSLSIPITRNSLSSAEALSGGPISARSLCLTTRLSQLSLTTPIYVPFKTTPIRMGGGPRTFPGGVSKWQWKRMQAKKAKQLLKARLARERQIYEMRKRAELKAAVSELERPWETVEKAPSLFSVSADEQLKVLADRFQKPGGLDLWSESDGPELFRPDNGLPSARFFPKGVVHSVKPYRKTESIDSASEELDSSGLEEDSNPGQISGNIEKMGLPGIGLGRSSRSNQNGWNNGRNVNNLEPRSLNGAEKEGENWSFKGKLRKGSTVTYSGDSNGKNTGNARFYNRDDRRSGRPGDNSDEVRRNGRPSDNSGEVRRSNSFKMDRSMKAVGKNTGSARSYNRDDRRSGRPGDNSGEVRRSGRPGDNSDEVRRSYSFRMDRSIKAEGKDTGNARSYNRDDRRSGIPGDNSGEVRKSNSFKMDGSMNAEGKNTGNARYYNRDDRRSGKPGDNSGEFRKSNSFKKDGSMSAEVFDMSLHNDGSYGFELNKSG